jgi:hypothetical protein
MSFRKKVAAWEGSLGQQKVAVDATSLLLGSALASPASPAGSGGGMFGGLMPKMVGVAAIEPLKPASGTFGYMLNKRIFDGLGGLLNRVNADETAAKRVIDELSKSVAVETLSGLKGLMASAKEHSRSPVRKAILKRLSSEDDIIAQASPDAMLRAYSTMSRVAPTLSTDINAVKSFLRSSAMHDGGIDSMTIKGLAEAETAVTGRWKKR